MLRPTTVAFMWLPSWSMISIGPSSSSASATTWLLVMTCPLSSRTNPDPVAPWSLPPYSATICTVLGSTLAATEAMLPLSAGSGGALRGSTRSTEPVPVESLATRAPASAPPARPSTSAISATAGHIHAGTFPRWGRSRAG